MGEQKLEMDRIHTFEGNVINAMTRHTSQAIDLPGWGRQPLSPLQTQSSVGSKMF